VLVSNITKTTTDNLSAIQLCAKLGEPEQKQAAEQQNRLFASILPQFEDSGIRHAVFFDSRGDLALWSSWKANWTTWNRLLNSFAPTSTNEMISLMKEMESAVMRSLEGQARKALKGENAGGRYEVIRSRDVAVLMLMYLWSNHKGETCLSRLRELSFASSSFVSDITSLRPLEIIFRNEALAYSSHLSELRDKSFSIPKTTHELEAIRTKHNRVTFIMQLANDVWGRPLKLKGTLKYIDNHSSLRKEWVLSCPDPRSEDQDMRVRTKPEIAVNLIDLPNGNYDLDIGLFAGERKLSGFSTNLVFTQAQKLGLQR
jgi:hypothetical protein